MNRNSTARVQVDGKTFYLRNFERNGRIRQHDGRWWFETMGDQKDIPVTDAYIQGTYLVTEGRRGHSHRILKIKDFMV